MTTLTKTHRDDAIESILREAFYPRFADIEKQIDRSIEEFIAEQHPSFVSALIDVEFRRYLAVGSVNNFFTSDEYCVAFPKYKTSDLPPKQGYHVSREFFTRVKSAVIVPTGVYNFVISEELTATYHKCWTDYISARNTLRDTFYSYRVREKLMVDFPEFEKYLPVIVVAASAPMIVAESVRANLSSLGVPAS